MPAQLTRPHGSHSTGNRTRGIPGSTPPATPTLHPDAIGSTPGTIPGIINFAMIDPGLYRGNQPTPEGFAQLKQLGVQFDIDLREEYNDDVDLRGSGPWNYAYSPWSADKIDPDQVAAVVKTMMTMAFEPLYVHCLHGADRTGCVVATYRIIKDHWTNQAALNEMLLFGFHTKYTNISDFISTLNPDDMRSRIARISALSFKLIN